MGRGSYWGFGNILKMFSFGSQFCKAFMGMGIVIGFW